MYKDFLILFSLILVHELGHFLVAFIFKWELSKIAIYPFGGCVKFNEKVNRLSKEELFVLLGGPLMQMIFFLIILFCFYGLIKTRNFYLLEKYHYTLLAFNLLPIYPLDGGKLVNLIANYLLPYKKGNKLVAYFSILFIVIAIVYMKEINFTMMIIFLLIDLFLYLKRQDYLYNKFLLERYLHPKKYKRLKIIKNKDNMYRDRRHVIKNKNKYMTEKDYLAYRFNK